MSAWQFNPSIGQKRMEALLQAPSFKDILDMLARDSDIVCCHLSRCDDRQGFSRTVFTLRTSSKTFDLLFNSERGYRGAYFLSAFDGLSANQTTIGRLTPLLLNWVARYAPTIDQTFAAKSLSLPSAKMWLAEAGTDLCDQCIGEWCNPTDDMPEILNDRWDIDDSPHARRGRKAPYLSKLRVYGAFLNKGEEEFVPPRKICRAQDINKYGWT